VGGGTVGGEGEDFVQRTEPVRTNLVPWPSSPTSPSLSSPSSSSSTSYESYSRSRSHSRSLPTLCYPLLYISSTPRTSLGVWIALSSPSSPFRPPSSSRKNPSRTSPVLTRNRMKRIILTMIMIPVTSAGIATCEGKI
jgi:hypothetical protein